MEKNRTSSPRDHGVLLAIGGAEDKTRERRILTRVVKEAGGKKGRIAILATASTLSETGDRYSDLFDDLGIGEVDVLPVSTRDDAISGGEELAKRLDLATGLFLTGGGQLRAMVAFSGTPLAAAIRRRFADGMMVAGTSAGASLLSEHMIAYGDGGSTPRQRQVQLSKGLGLAPDAIIDQHFRRRDRLGRLLVAISYNSEPLGLGVDEDTAAIFLPDGTLEVLGSGVVTVVDAAGMRFSDSHHALPGRPLTLLGLKLDVLADGARYDTATRRGLPPLD